MPDLPYAGATAEQLRHPMVNELLTVHNLFRTQLTTIVQYVKDLMAGEEQLKAPETQARIQALIKAGTQYTHMLHTHHHLETSMMFPALQKEGLEVTVVDRLNQEHDEIAVLIDQFSEAIQSFAAIDPDVMNNDLRRLSDALQNHLAYEETHVCPVLAHFSSWNMR